MATLVSEMRDPVRFLLGDNEEPFRYTDGVIDRGVRVIARGGVIPGHSLTPDTTGITPDLTDPNLYLLTAYEVAKRFAANVPDRRSFKTRAFSESVGGMGGLVFALEENAYKLRNGEMFDGWTSFGSWLIGVGGLTGTQLWNHMSRFVSEQPMDTVTLGPDRLSTS